MADVLPFRPLWQDALGPPKTALQRMQDTWQNLMAGFGVAGRDKAAAQQFTLQLLDPAQLEMAYRGDWICRKVVDVPAFDATRAWREWQAEREQIEKIEEAEKQLGMQRKLLSALTPRELRDN